ncbi:hypothetical protein [Amphritea sp. HPY]|uniref:hypothetical protein n=1 Tax=Amphritea sp. HPY TaxID=3421652 RepID=UPI003D7ED665
MSDSYAPLFNRTYLKAVFWIVAIVIVLLSAGGNDHNDYVSIQKADSRPVYSVTLNDSPSLQLQLIFRLGAAISTDQQLMHKLLLQLIEQQLDSAEASRLMQPMQIRNNIQLQDDRLTLQLTIPAGFLDDHQRLAELPQQLIRQLRDINLNGTLEQRWNRLEAESYLQQKDPEQHLLSVFGELISHGPGVHPLQRFADFYRSRIEISQLTVALHGPQAGLIAQAIGKQLPDYQSNIALTNVAIPPIQERLTASGNTPYSLAGMAVPGRQQDGFLKELLAVRTLQTMLDNQQDLKYRLQWKSLDNSGYLAMMLHGPRLPQNPAQLKQQLAPLLLQLDDDLIDQTRSTLQDRFQQQMEQQEAQLALLNSIAFYRLPLDYMANFQNNLSQIDNQAIRQRLGEYLDTERLHFIYLPAF